MKQQTPRKGRSGNSLSSRSRKKRRRVRNWCEYNTALVRRGEVTLWADRDVLEQWRSEVRTGKRGRPCVYAEQLIGCVLTLGTVYRLPLRATQGLFTSLVRLLGLPLRAPHYSTLCRRRAKMQAALPREEAQSERGEPLHLAVDSTGLKVSGEGEWKVRKYGALSFAANDRTSGDSGAKCIWRWTQTRA